jgi:hypothetical protein
MHIEDLKKVAPLWLKWTEEVRADPDSWGNTGDIFNANGKAGPPWIAEMYGYVFACAEVGLDFKVSPAGLAGTNTAVLTCLSESFSPQVSDKFMLYPGYAPPAAEPWPVVRRPCVHAAPIPALMHTCTGDALWHHVQRVRLRF